MRNSGVIPRYTFSSSCNRTLGKIYLYYITTDRTMNFKELPPIFDTVSQDLAEKPRDFAAIVDLLEISYRLLGHPFFGRWRSFTPMNAFQVDRNKLEIYKTFNQTVIERTIAQGRQFSKLEVFEFATLTLTTKATEMSLTLLRSTWQEANKIIGMDEKEQTDKFGSIQYFRLTRFGEIVAIVKDLLFSCNHLIGVQYKHWVHVQAEKISDRKERVAYLLKAKKELLHQKDQFIEAEFNKLLDFLEIELTHYRELQENDRSEDNIAQMNQFLQQRTSKLSNARLLGFLLNDQINEFIDGLEEWVIRGLSYHDIGGDEPERVYHAFLTGSFHTFSNYYVVQSNRESGLGRFDILLKPLDMEVKGIIFEVKRAPTRRDDTITKMLDEALHQVIRNKYAYELKDRGTTEFVALALVFYNKEVFIKHQLCAIP